MSRHKWWQLGYSLAAVAARFTPTPIDDKAVQGAGVFRRGLRRVANSIRRRGALLLVLAAIPALASCRTIVWADDFLPEYVPCAPKAP
jgi:hypothetical protein